MDLHGASGVGKSNTSATTIDVGSGFFVLVRRCRAVMRAAP